jgi:signal transduction histidine kinase
MSTSAAPVPVPGGAPRPSRELLRASWRHWLTMDGPAPGPWWLPWLWTMLFTVVVAFGFTLVGFAISRAPLARWLDASAWAYWLGVNLVVTGTIAVLIHVLFAVLNPRLRDPRIARWKPWQVSLYHAAIPVTGVLVGWPLGMALLGDAIGRHFRWATQPMAMVGMLIVSVIVALVLHQWFSAKARQLLAEREATEAQLRLLQGQIEPHFIFNTLANVSSLMEVDVPRARRMLDHFTDYLRGSLQGLREPWRPLGDEVALVETYLAVQSVRMEQRLRTEIDVPADLRTLPVPTLAIQPLVENAVLHGLEPAVDGGTVRLSARREGATLVIAVEDNGVGLDAAPGAGGPAGSRRAGGGHGLANLRARLGRLDDGTAGLTIASRPLHGVRAELRLPVRPTSAT